MGTQGERKEKATILYQFLNNSFLFSFYSSDSNGVLKLFSAKLVLLSSTVSAKTGNTNSGEVSLSSKCPDVKIKY